MAKQSESSQKTNRQRRVKKISLDFAVSSIKIANEIPELNSESLYDLTDENISKLRELIDAPFISFEGIEKYPTLEEKAAVIFCITIRGHKFGNGNKRTAVILLLTMLYVNEKWLTLSWAALYELAMKTAKDTHTNFETRIEEIAKILSENTITLEG